jgi:hypothetical protein
LRVFDFLVSRWLLNALYLRILPVPVTLKVFLARECVFNFGIDPKIWDGKGNKYSYLNRNNNRYFGIFFILIYAGAKKLFPATAILHPNNAILWLFLRG